MWSHLARTTESTSSTVFILFYMKILAVDMAQSSCYPLHASIAELRFWDKDGTAAYVGSLGLNNPWFNLEAVVIHRFLTAKRAIFLIHQFEFSRVCAALDRCFIKMLIL